MFVKSEEDRWQKRVERNLRDYHRRSVVYTSRRESSVSVSHRAKQSLMTSTMTQLSTADQRRRSGELYVPAKHSTYISYLIDTIVNLPFGCETLQVLLPFPPGVVVLLITRLIPQYIPTKPTADNQPQQPAYWVHKPCRPRECKTRLRAVQEDQELR